MMSVSSLIIKVFNKLRCWMGGHEVNYYNQGSIIIKGCRHCPEKWYWDSYIWRYMEGGG